MTRKEKEALIKHLDVVVPKEYLINFNDAFWSTSDVKAAISDFVDESDYTATVNYESEYKKLMESYKKLEDDNKKLKFVVKVIEFVTGREFEY